MVSSKVVSLASKGSGPQLSPQERLDSWKEIAAYLRRGPRTVQRWEQELGLPVHRLARGQRGQVFAYKPELDAWWNSKPAQSEKPKRADLREGASARLPLWLWGVVLAVVILAAIAAKWLLP
jgi:hypothetical protein